MVQIFFVGVESVFVFEKAYFVFGGVATVLFSSLLLNFWLWKQLRCSLQKNTTQTSIEFRTRIAKLASMGEVAGAVAHEISNPLTLLLANSERLQEIADSPNQERSTELKYIAGVIRKVTLSVIKISTTIRGLSHAAEPGSLETVLLRDVFDDVNFLCREKFLASAIQLTIPTAEQDLKVCGRPTELCQIIMNLVLNARDAVANLKERWVKVDIAQTPKYVEISVTDSGRGIPKEIQAKIFEAFFTTKLENQGAGLGLDLCRQLASRIGGEVFLDTEHKHTRFVVKLPRPSPNATGSILLHPEQTILEEPSI